MVVCRNRRDLRVGDRYLWVERREFQMLLVLLGAVVASSERDDHRVFTLHFAQAPHGTRMVRQFVVGECRAGDDVCSHSSSIPVRVRGWFGWQRGGGSRVVGTLPGLTRDDVGGIPGGPIVLCRTRFIQIG